MYNCFWFTVDVVKQNVKMMPFIETCLRNKLILLVDLDEFHMNRMRDEWQTNVAEHEPPLLSNEIKRQLLNKEEMLKRGRAQERASEQARERDEWGDFVQPGNWSHHKQIEFRSFWWARADQSIWPSTQCLSASQKDTLASNNTSTVNNWSPGSVSLC